MATTATAPADRAPHPQHDAIGSASDRASSCCSGGRLHVLALIAGMVLFVFAKAWPSFAHNGLAWFGGGNVDQQLADIFNSPADPSKLRLHARRLAAARRDDSSPPRAAVVVGMAFALFAAIFIVEFAPAARCAAMIEPVVRLLAAVRRWSTG